MAEGLHMAHITHYQVIRNTDTGELATAVETAIHDGWQPFGSVAVAAGGQGVPVFVQPIVKYAEWFR